MEKPGSYHQLVAFKNAYAFALEVHRTTKLFPKEEQFRGIADQLRRSSKSICANIVEGHAKKPKSKPEFIRFIWIAIGTTDETKLWIQFSYDLGYITAKQYSGWNDKCQHIAAMLYGLAKA